MTILLVYVLFVGEVFFLLIKFEKVLLYIDGQ